MKKLSFWKADWFIGLIVVVIMLIAARGDLIQSLERKAYDLGVQAAARVPSDRIAVIAIDDASIANIGRWPWSRDVHARMIDLLAGAKAKVIANTTFFFEPQRDAGLAYVEKLLNLHNELTAQGAADPKAVANEGLARIGAVLTEAEQALNTDRKLASSMKSAGNVVLPLVFQQLTEPQGNPDKPLPAYVLASGMPGPRGADRLPPPGVFPLYPVAELGPAVAGIGHLNADIDVDGAVRAEPLLVRYYDQVFPALSVVVAARSLNLGVADIKPAWGEGLQIGKLRVRTDAELRMHTFFYADRDGRPAFPVDSFFDVLSGKVPVAKYQDKIVLIGATAAGLGSAQVTPVSPATAPVLTLAHTVSSILGEHFFVTPSWGLWVQLGVFLLVALYLIVVLPRLKAGIAALLSLAIGVVLLGAHFGLMVTQLTWIQLMGSVALLAVGYAALTTKRFLVTERGKEKSDAESAESSRMLGIAYQAQGQLDLAWDKFRQCPLADPVMENLYALALDFERKRRAAAAHAASLGPDHRRLLRHLRRRTAHAGRQHPALHPGPISASTSPSRQAASVRRLQGMTLKFGGLAHEDSLAHQVGEALDASGAGRDLPEVAPEIGLGELQFGHFAGRDFLGRGVGHRQQRLGVAGGEGGVDVRSGGHRQQLDRKRRIAGLGQQQRKHIGVGRRDKPHRFGRRGSYSQNTCSRLCGVDGTCPGVSTTTAACCQGTQKTGQHRNCGAPTVVLRVHRSGPVQS